MPAVSAGTCDPIEATLRSSLEGAGSGNYLDDQIISTAKRVLFTKIDYHPAEKEYSSPLKSLQTKYIHLNSNSERSDGSLNHKDDNHGTSSVKGNREECKVDADGIPIPRIVIHPSDSIKLGWLRVYKIGAGLANLGNTCFLNATLQCLTYTPPLVNHLIEFNEHSTACKNVGFCMMCELQRHIRRALEKNGEIIRPQCILQKLKSIAAHMSWGRQEDAHEFLHYMMESMISSSLNGYSTAKLDRVSYETTVVNQIFGGHHRSQVICLRCKEKSDTYDHFMDVMLDIKNVPSLEKALEHFVQPEILDNENAYMCPKCKQKCPAKKRFTIHRAPNILTFQLKRFDYSRSMGGKITKHVSFPEKFDMRAYMSQRQGPPIVYLLYAVLVHQGVSCNSGHYFCFVRNSNNLWYLMDDSKVRQVSVNFVLSQQAYLLFYTRIPHSGQMLKSPLPLPAVNNRLPLTPVSSASSSATSSNGNTNNISNGVAGKSVSDSFGVPLMRKSNPLVSNNLVKPKSNASTVVNTAIAVKPSGVTGVSNTSSSSSVLPSNREKITFDFKLANCHLPQSSSSSSSKVNLSPGNVSGCGGGGNPSDRNCNNVVDTGQPQPKHPRIVMQIKNGKVYNYQTSTNAARNVSCVATTCLVPYGPDSSEDSDQDSGRTGNHVRSPGRPGSKMNSKCLLEMRDWNTTKVKLDPQLNATTQLPGLPKSKLVDDKEGESKDCNGSQGSSSSSALSSGGSFVKKQAPSSDGQLMVLTNCGTTSGKINATSSWVVLDSNQQSPSLASEGSNTSVNSTSEWTVHDDKEGNGSKMERQYSKWTVTSSSDSGLGSVNSGICSPSGAKKVAVPSAAATVSKCERTRESESVVHHHHHHQNSPKKSVNNKELKLVIVSGASRNCESLSTSRHQPIPSSLSTPPPVTNSITNSSSEYKWTNGVAGDDEFPPDRDVQKRLGHQQRDSPDIRSPVQDRSSDHDDESKSVVDGREDGNSSVVRESTSRRRRSPPVVNGIEGSGGGSGTGTSESPLDDQNSKHRKKKRKHKKDRESLPNDDSQKWRNRVGHRKESCVPNGKVDEGSASPSKRRKRHSSDDAGDNSSSNSSSSDGYELEWVEKTKETLEKGAGDGVNVRKDDDDGSKTCRVSWDNDAKADSLQKPSQPHCNGNILTRTEDDSEDVNPSLSGDFQNNSLVTVAELIKKGGRGYGEGVNTWDGSRSVVNRDVDQSAAFNWREKYSDEYNDEYDRGKVKKVKKQWRYLNPNSIASSNPFQRMQEMKTAGNYFKPTRWHSSPHSPYQWDGRHHHHHHHNNNNNNSNNNSSSNSGNNSNSSNNNHNHHRHRRQRGNMRNHSVQQYHSGNRNSYYFHHKH